MRIIIGLGNPEEKYTGTRHNIGFYFLDKIKEILGFPEFSLENKFKAEVSKDKEIILVKPITFMNLSGEAVREILGFYKLTPTDIIVIHDDLDIELGNYKIATDSRSAGHNGVQDIIEKIGTQNFTRVRIGIGHSDAVPAESYVLQKFSPEEMEKIQTIEKDILTEIKKLL